MTQRYSGLVVGGPLDGQMLEATHNMLRAEKDPRPCYATVQLHEGGEIPKFETVTYLYDRGIWFPSDTTFEWAMSQLFTTYQARARK